MIRHALIAVSFAACMPPASGTYNTYGPPAPAQPPNAELEQCLATAQGDEAIDQCEKLAFGPDLQFSAGRVLHASDPNLTTIQPPMLTQNGDVVAFQANGMQCGMIGMASGRAYGTFVICDGQVLAGPLTSQAENDQAIAIIAQAIRAEQAAPYGGGGGDAGDAAAMSAYSFNLRKSVTDSFPTGGPGVTVHDRATGRPLYSTY